MFFQLSENEMLPVEAEKINPDILTVGYLKVDELIEHSARFGFDENTVSACKNANALFRSGVEVHDDYTFTELRILNENGKEKSDDYIALFIKRNLMLVVDIWDADGSTKEKCLAAVRKYSPQKVSCEKILAAFLDSLFAGDYKVLGAIDLDLAEQEEKLFEKKSDKDFNLHLLRTKKLLTKRYSYYSQLLDIAEAVCENSNGIFAETNLNYVDNAAKRLARLREDTAGLKNTVEHLQDAYSSCIDSDTNHTMKVLTVLASIFSPLTIIVGWYGMNFQNMPELTWKYGYVYVIVLSITTVLIFALIGKWKKWF